MIKTDIHNYFPSVTESEVYKVFFDLGYSPLVSFEFARLCTWRGAQSSRQGQSVLRPSGGQGWRLPYPVLTEGVLPQGAPTSGALANASTRQLDDGLSALAIKHHLVYTRYSDDMTFSSPEQFDRQNASAIIGEIGRIVTASGLEIHVRKTKIIPPGARKIVLGMLVTESGVAVLPEQRRMIDIHIHAVGKYGPVEYSAVRKFDSVFSFINHVEGWFAYLSHIDPEWTHLKVKEWREVLGSHHVLTGALG